LGEDHDDVKLSVAFFPQIGYLVAIPNDKGSKIQDYSQDDTNSPLGVPVHKSLLSACSRKKHRESFEWMGARAHVYVYNICVCLSP
jgi:hypothetical protein